MDNKTIIIRAMATQVVGTKSDPATFTREETIAHAYLKLLTDKTPPASLTENKIKALELAARFCASQQLDARDAEYVVTVAKAFEEYLNQ